MTDVQKPDGRQTLVLVDATALAHQFYHAIPPMTAPDGRPTHVVFGFARDLFAFRDDLQPDYLVYVFDAPGENFRSALATDYKAQRKPPADDLVAQFPLLDELLAAARVPVLRVPGYEADDVIATLAKAGEARGLSVLIASSDKDCRQLVSDRVRILNLRQKTLIDRQTIEKEWGITPEQAVDYQALVGDSVDNVKGVPGVGGKTAAKLLRQFGTLDNLLAHVDSLDGIVTPRVQAALKQAIADGSLELGRKLVRLDTHVPIDIDWSKWHRPEWDVTRLRELFQQWGFRSLLKQLPAEPPKGDLFANLEIPSTSRSTLSNPPRSSSDSWQADYRLIDTPHAFRDFLQELSRQRRFAFDVETTGTDPLSSHLVGIAFCWSSGRAHYLALRSPEGEPHLETDAVIDSLRPIFEDDTIQKVNQNIKFDALALRHHQVHLRGIAGDPMIADYLLHAGERSHSLDELAQRYLHHTNIPIEELIGRGKKQKTMDQVSPQKVAVYAGEDADVAWRLVELLEPQLEREGLKSLYDRLEIPLIDVLIEIEATGIRLDTAFLQRLSGQMQEQLAEMESEIHRLAGRSFNIDSPRQLAQVLFEELKLPVQKKTGVTGAASTDRETLERLAVLGYELPRRLIEYREISKLKGTYVDALPKLVNPGTGRVHTSFNQTVAATGRLSSSEPNLQNIPTRTDTGKQIRQAFIPEDGWVLVTADYSQIELRLLAHFCGDETLRRAFEEDRDVHTAVAAQIFQVPEDQVTPNQRRLAKTVNFGVLYGMSAYGLAVRLGISREEAGRFINDYFARYPKVLEYQQNLLAKCRQTGYVATILGRRRRFEPSAIRPHTTYRDRTQAEREAINMEIQGSAADLLKQAMLQVHRRLKSEKLRARMLLTVHDELVFESPPDEVRRVAHVAREEMGGAIPVSVPLKVDVSAGPNWLDVTEVA